MKLAFLLFISLQVFANDQQLKICLTGSTEKALPKYGEAFVNGAMLAHKELSKTDKDRVLIVPDYYDSTPLAPIEKLNELRKNNCDAIIGFSTGNDLLLIEDNLKQDPILTLSIYGDPQDSFNKTNYLRTMQPSAEDLVSHLFRMLPIEIKKQDKILIITAADRSEMLAYREAYLRQIKAFSNQVTQVEVMEQTHDIVKMKDLINKDHKWDLVIMLTRSLLAAELTDMLYLYSKPVILGTKYFGSSELPAFYNYLKNKDVTAFFSRQNCSCDSSVGFKNFLKTYLTEYNIQPMSISVDSYDATKFMFKSLKQPKITRKSVIHSLNSEESTFNGVSSVQISNGLNLSSSKRFLIKIDKNGYKEVK